jgi:hypothetical protein
LPINFLLPLSNRRLWKVSGLTINNEGREMETVEEFLARGGKVNSIPAGEKKAKEFNPDWLRGCKCGCRGNYTDHSMRCGERGEH